jgi:hypothetical protein
MFWHPTSANEWFTTRRSVPRPAQDKTTGSRINKVGSNGAFYDQAKAETHARRKESAAKASRGVHDDLRQREAEAGQDRVITWDKKLFLQDRARMATLSATYLVKLFGGPYRNV